MDLLETEALGGRAAFAMRAALRARATEIAPVLMAGSARASDFFMREVKEVTVRESRHTGYVRRAAAARTRQPYERARDQQHHATAADTIPAHEEWATTARRTTY